MKDLAAFVFLLFATTTMASNNSERVLKANADFTANLYQVLAKSSDANLIFSPISAHTVLSLAYQGAAGATAQSFASTLKLPDANTAKDGYKSVIESLNNVQNVTLHVANKIYAKSGYKLKAAFGDVAKSAFYSEVEQVNFSDKTNAAKTINSWVENKTKDKIKDLISPDSLDDLTRLILINAIYFKGNWANKFDKSKTKKEPFYLDDSNKIDVDTMHITKKFRFGVNENLDAKILELPYENRDVSMLIILPNQRNGLKALEAKLATVDVTTLANHLYTAEVNVALPKFKIESKIELNDVLKELGLGVIFTDAADFSGILESPEALKVSQVLQKAFIEVNEEGAEAAAATGMIMMTRAMPMRPENREFIADHPFLFLLLQRQEKGGNVLFEGKLADPSN